MAKSIVEYDKDLPEIEGRDKYQRPDSYLQKKKGTDKYEVIEKRRPSKILIVNKLRQEVDKWREQGYPGASKTTLRLFQFWFEEDHLLNDELFRYYFCQREAVETLVYIIEILRNKDLIPLIRKFAIVQQLKLGDESGLIFQTTMDGKRQLRRYFDEINKDGVQDLPPENLRRYSIKMATGSGKTVVMAMMIAWSYFHKKFENNSDLSTNFLILAPNVIVYQRLEKDFASNKIFNELPLVPPEWTFNMKVILRGEESNFDPSANLILTNIHQIYESREKKWTPINAVDALLGKKPSNSNSISMFEKIKQLENLIVLNDEAHHIHDQELEWDKTLMSINEALPTGLSLWLDFTATPKDQNGTFFPWVVCDYPLAQAVEDRIVKAPIIVHQVNKKDPGDVTRDNIIQKYGEWILAAYDRWKDHNKVYKKLKKKPVLFIMCTKSVFADVIGDWIIKNNQFKLKHDEVLIIHTDTKGEITKGDLELARESARDIDNPNNKVKVIVSVLMLKEGWDVRNVTVVLGLRPFTAKANILPEQAVGRGLRLINAISPDSTQTLEVMGTEAFEDFVRKLELEGVSIKTVNEGPKPPIWVEPIEQKKKFDISIPLTKPIHFHNYKKFDLIDVRKFEPIFKQKELMDPIIKQQIMEFATTETVVAKRETKYGILPNSNDLLSSITREVMREAKLSGVFSKMYPLVKVYVQEKCFNKKINLENEKVRGHLKEITLQLSIARYLARKFSELVLETKNLEFEDEFFTLSKTKPFTWRRKHIKANKTIFNYVATFNNYESDFAEFLDKCKDIVKFAALAEQFTRFRVDYLSKNGSLKFYYPDFIAVQKEGKKEIKYIIETKGRVYDNVKYKDDAIKEWCKRISKQSDKEEWKYVRVNQSEVSSRRFNDLNLFKDLIKYIEKLK